MINTVQKTIRKSSNEGLFFIKQVAKYFMDFLEIKGGCFPSYNSPQNLITPQ